MSDRRHPVIDLFSGPGGLGEGFHSLTSEGQHSVFDLLVSIEKEPWAHKTLLMRACYRHLMAHGTPEEVDSWYRWLQEPTLENYSELFSGSSRAMTEANKVAHCHELGLKKKDDHKLDKYIKARLNECYPGRAPVLIGGPPCQAYSLVGRSRNQGNAEYTASEDHRHFLYLEYLRIVSLVKPAVFIMENVRGMLSSKVEGERIFPRILNDLVCPGMAVNGPKRLRYEVHSLVSDTVFRDGENAAAVDGRDFLIKSNEYGVPQRRDRVILMGIRSDVAARLTSVPRLTRSECETDVASALSGLPPLRSRLSRGGDSLESWLNTVGTNSEELTRKLPGSRTASKGAEANQRLARLATWISKQTFEEGRSTLDVGAVSAQMGSALQTDVPKELRDWYFDPKLECVLNHETRGHISADLMRYLFTASYACVYGVSPKREDFPSFLAPNHKSWTSGNFADRFRVQVAGYPSTTITSHISKDGHYFIHPDPLQCRSLTVREAARLQTFPDNYVFMGPRTAQYVQVGNAVPPFLARQIAGVVARVLKQIE